MPTYSYHCATCGHDFEKVQRITADPERVCPACGAETAARVITSANFILKGSGWYADAYSGGSNKKTETAPAASKPEGAPAVKSDATATATGTSGAAGASTSATATPPAASSHSTGSTGSGSTSTPSGTSGS